MTKLRAVVAATALLLLTACGVHPGAAAIVGEQRIPTSEVETFAQGFCQFSAQPGRPPIAMSQLLGQSVNQLVSNELQSKFIAAKGIGYDHAAYAEAMTNVEARAKQLDPSLREGFLVIVKEIVINSLSQQALGMASLKAAGTEEPTSDDAAAEGQKLFTAWAKSADIKVTVDPRYGASGESAGAQGSISRSVSKVAKSAATGGDAAMLPAAQVCMSK